MTKREQTAYEDYIGICTVLGIQYKDPFAVVYLTKDQELWYPEWEEHYQSILKRHGVASAHAFYEKHSKAP